MVRLPLFLAALLMSAGLASAAVEDRGAVAASLAALTAQDVRAATIGYRLATGAAALCTDHSNLPGMVVQHIAQYRADLRPVAAELYGFGDGAGVVAVVPGGAAEAAGVRAKDRVLAVGGVAIAPLEAGAKRKADQDQITELVGLLERSFAAGPVTLTIERGGQRQEIVVAGKPGCASAFQVELGGGVNAGADGRIVTISEGMMANSPDDGLAYVIAHELSHNILHHPQRLDEQKVNRGLLAGFGKNRTRILATEMEADYYSLYVMIAAGFPIDGVPAYWKGMARFGPGIFGDGTHLGNGSRVKFLERVVAEVHAKQRAGGPVKPNYAAFAAAGGTAT